ERVREIERHEAASEIAKRATPSGSRKEPKNEQQAAGHNQSSCSIRGNCALPTSARARGSTSARFRQIAGYSCLSLMRAFLVPVGLGVVGIAVVLPGGDFVDEDLFVGNAAIEALGR